MEGSIWEVFKNASVKVMERWLRGMEESDEVQGDKFDKDNIQFENFSNTLYNLFYEIRLALSKSTLVLYLFFTRTGKLLHTSLSSFKNF